MKSNCPLPRGAGASKGRTSWQAKAELDDYMSFTGFLVHYVEGLRASSAHMQSASVTDPILTPIPSAHALPSSPIDKENEGMTLILGGYSYGSLIATHLPTTQDILRRFETVTKGSAESEIKLRAGNLARQWTKDAKLYLEAQHARRSESQKMRLSARATAVAMGGDESAPGDRRLSHEGRRSLDTLRRSMDRSRRKLGSRHHSHSSHTSDFIAVKESLAPLNIPLPRTCYLLISPILPPLSMFATMFSSIRSDRSPDCNGKFIHHPTLAIYGDDDFFTSQRKLRKWAERLKAPTGSQFQFREIAGAGHFWREEGADGQMRGCIRGWVQEIAGG